MQLSKITSERQELAVAFGEDVLNLVFRPQAVTLELVDRKEQALSNPGDVLAQTLVDLVESWDLVEDNGATYPLTLAAVRKLPLEFVNGILEAILKESRLNPTKANSLGDGSPRAGSLASNRNGTH